MGSKAVFMDIDGTLMEKGVISEKVIAAIRKARSCGHMFFICSGRSVGHLPKILREADFLDGFVMSCGMYCEVRGEVVFRELIGIEDLRAAARYFCESKTACRFDGETKMIALNFKRDDCLCLENFEAIDAEFGAEPISKLTIPGAYKDEYGAFFGDRYDVYDMGGWTDVVPKGMTKATGMQLVLDHVGISRADSIGVGDGTNDLPMIKYAGLGVAMGNAPVHVKAEADAVTETCENDGVAAMIEKYVLNNNGGLHMNAAEKLLHEAKRYNHTTDFLRSAYGLSSEEIFDAYVIAPGWTPEKILAKYDAKIENIALKSGYSTYIAEFDGVRLGWIKCGMSSSNVIDAMISLADTRTEPVIFLGAVGALKADIEIGELCTPLVSYAYDGASLYLHEKLSAENFGRAVRPACADFIGKVLDSAAKSGIKITRRPTFCTDSIICEYAHLDEIKGTGAELIEMETAAFYECLAMMDKKGIALLCVSDNSAGGVPLVERTPQQRKRYDECRTREIPEAIKLAVQSSARFHSPSSL